MFYTAAWCINDEESFRKAIPFELLGESVQQHNSKIKFNIVILEGIQLLSKEYLNSLENYGFRIIDYCEDFLAIVGRYERLNEFYVRYERNCFLRWIAFKEILEQHKASQFWHLDGDLVLYTSLDDLAKDTKGKNFMLQGCPVFVSVASFNWFQLFEKELNSLNENILEYSNIAFKLKSECKKNDLKLANDSLYRNPIGSDQDLLEYLISAKKIPQDSAEIIFDSKYYFIQNPLSLNKWHMPQAVIGFFNEDNKKNKIIIGKKEVPFIHYQGTFSNYAEIYLFLYNLRIPEVIINAFLDFKITEDKLKTSLVFRILFKFHKRSIQKKGRSRLIKQLQQSRKGKLIIVRLLNFLLH